MTSSTSILPDPATESTPLARRLKPPEPICPSDVAEAWLLLNCGDCYALSGLCPTCRDHVHRRASQADAA